jgi:hypothetical protein
LDLEESKASGQQQASAVPAVRVKVTGTPTATTLPNQGPKDVQAIVETIKAKVSEAVYKKPPRICVAVTAIEVSQAVADHLRNQGPPGRKKTAEGPVVAQSLTLVVDDERVFQTSKPLSCERHAFPTVVERMSGVKLKELLRSRSSFVIYSQIERSGNGCLSYDKIKDSGDRDRQNGSNRRNDREAETSRFSQPARMTLFVGRR